MGDREHDADALLREAERQLATADSAPFSVQSFHLLKLKASAYIRSLIIESDRVARRRRADVISAADVEDASDYLVTSSSQRWFRHLGTVGGILLGASLSNFLAMITSNQYSPTGVTTSAVLAVLGAFGVALHIGKE